MRVGFLSPDWGDHRDTIAGGCTWIRCVTVADALKKIGVDAVVGEFGWVDGEGFVAVHPFERMIAGHRGPVSNSQNRSDRLDVVVFKLWMWHQHKEMIAEAQRLGQKIIIDIDDFFDGLPLDNIAYKHTSKDLDALWNRDHMIKSYSEADAIITSTQFLYDFYKDRNENMFLIRNAILPELFMRRMDVAGDKPTIGWVGILAWRQDDLRELQGVLGPFLDEHNLKFHHAGILPDNTHAICDLMKINPERLVGTTGCSPQNYGNILLPIDIGLVPLTKNRFNEAKSSLKGMEYCLTGIPFIASSTHEYRLLNEQGAGRIASKKIEWRKNLERFLDQDVRRAEAEKNYQVVFEQYNLNKRVYEWADVIEKIYTKDR